MRWRCDYRILQVRQTDQAVSGRMSGDRQGVDVGVISIALHATRGTVFRATGRMNSPLQQLANFLLEARLGPYAEAAWIP